MEEKLYHATKSHQVWIGDVAFKDIHLTGFIDGQGNSGSAANSGAPEADISHNSRKRTLRETSTRGRRTDAPSGISSGAITRRLPTDKYIGDIHMTPAKMSKPSKKNRKPH